MVRKTHPTMEFPLVPKLHLGTYLNLLGDEKKRPTARPLQGKFQRPDAPTRHCASQHQPG
jgi:hypothetical protein